MKTSLALLQAALLISLLNASVVYAGADSSGGTGDWIWSDFPAVAPLLPSDVGLSDNKLTKAVATCLADDPIFLKMAFVENAPAEPPRLVLKNLYEVPMHMWGYPKPEFVGALRIITFPEGEFRLADKSVVMFTRDTFSFEFHPGRSIAFVRFSGKPGQAPANFVDHNDSLPISVAFSKIDEKSHKRFGISALYDYRHFQIKPDELEHASPYAACLKRELRKAAGLQ